MPNSTSAKSYIICTHMRTWAVDRPAVLPSCYALRWSSCRPARRYALRWSSPLSCYALRGLSIVGTLPFAGNAVKHCRFFHSLEGLPFSGYFAIRWKVCHSLETLAVAGCFVNRWKVCQSLETLSIAGRSVNHWKHCKALLFLPFIGNVGVRWMLCHLLEGLPFTGYFVIRWKVCRPLASFPQNNNAGKVWAGAGRIAGGTSKGPRPHSRMNRRGFCGWGYQTMQSGPGGQKIHPAWRS